MKKYKRIAFLLLTGIIVVLSILIYNNFFVKNKKNSTEKTISEVEFLETKLVKLLNEMNNIETRNYNISVSEITKQSKEQKSQKNSTQGNGSQSESNSNQSSSGDSQSTSDSVGKETSDMSGSDEEKTERFDLKVNGVLTNTEQIDWEKIKGQVETLYSSLPTITLDLYQSNTNKEEILGFNNEFDNFTITVKEENKEKTLNELSKLYDYIPKFIENTGNDEIQKNIIETKSHIFKAYSKLDSKNWEEISEDITKSIEVYSQLLTNPNIEKSKRYSISKIYIMINELQNAVKLQDETVFLIKYKNILEEMNNL